MDIQLRPQWDVGPAGGPRIDTTALLALLAGVQESGSLANAARAAGQSYRHAWGLIKHAEALFGAPLLASGRGRGSVLTELAVVWVLRSRRAAWRSRPSTALAASSAAVAMLVLCLPWTGPFAGLFGLTPLRPSLLAILVALVVGYILVTEFAKHWFYRTRPRRQRRQGASSPSR